LFWWGGGGGGGGGGVLEKVNRELVRYLAM